LANRFRFLPQARAQAVRSGIAAADNDNVFSGRKDFLHRVDFISCNAAVLLRQEFQRIMHTLQFPAGNGKIPRRFGPAAKQHGVVRAAQFIRGNIHAHMRARGKNDSFRLHLFDAAVDQLLFQLEIRYAVPQ
jgi:hypothetical protein